MQPFCLALVQASMEREESQDLSLRKDVFQIAVRNDGQLRDVIAAISSIAFTLPSAHSAGGIQSDLDVKMLSSQ